MNDVDPTAPTDLGDSTPVGPRRPVLARSEEEEPPPELLRNLPMGSEPTEPAMEPVNDEPQGGAPETPAYSGGYRLGKLPRDVRYGVEQARPADTAERNLAKLLQNLPVGGELTAAEMDSAEGIPLEEGGGAGETVDRHLVSALRKMWDGNGSPRFEPIDPTEHDLTFLDRYLVLEILGEGGMGTVFKAYDQVLRRIVAVKLLHGVIAERHGQRLVREALALAQVSHPNVVQVFDFGESERQAFVAMELVEGQTLREWQASVPRPSWVDCVKAYIQLGHGLAAMHERGLTHRDFKPENCVIDDDERQPRVIDFGLVGGVTENKPPRQPLATGNHDDEQGPRGGLADWTATGEGVVMGTLPYMPPEQLQAKPTDARSDQFSFCVALYEAIYDELPFDGDTFEARARNVTRGKVRAEPKHSRVPIGLRQALLRGLSPEPAERWPSMSHLVAALEDSPLPMLVPIRVPLVIMAIWLVFSGLLILLVRCGLYFPHG